MRQPTVVLLFFYSLFSFGQYSSDCFTDNRIKHDIEINNLFHKPSPHDTLGANDIISINKATKQKVVGCKYPNDTLKPAIGKFIVLDKITSDFVIINFNYLHDGNSLNQLNELDSIKKQLGKNVTVISLFSHDKKDIQFLIDKYGNSIIFITSADKYIKNHNLDLGTPTTFVLDKKKIIKHVSTGGYSETGRLFSELVPYLK